MTKDYPHRPFGMPVVKHTLYTSGNTMITRAPWPAPSNKYYVIRKLIATNLNNTSGGVINIWDQDLSNTTPVARGSGASPLIVVSLPANASGFANTAQSTIISQDQMPPEYFQAGITCSTTPANISGISISLELEVC